MANSEIDQIFASKATPLPAQPPKPSKKDKKRKRQAPEPDSQSGKGPETIVDPSSTLPDSKRVKLSKTPAKSTTKKDNQSFKDSRGSGPRMSGISPPSSCLYAHAAQGRKTEEGYSIYKAAELGIKEDDQGGGIHVVSRRFSALIFSTNRHTSLPV
ncbi:hypothetical protein D9757_002792 [Collybiopsis confluens]|uniref:Uncharacterized protein n=1 Tax=Collybiopsis confluens TaxID=2823264 RepID=A0A8H5HVW0_9AGAR|nr:hypothetical protein D9757_002792 [Collybiopsis confluens]